ncbi:ankyrin 2,3/unc44 [Trichoderma guizhouense]|uniref:Ankyrin 2,3/unc44 n=1 Tax=Trichoderma guizhouense TaxID=1491466 RepID=A0A1T3CA11_9HYPO|nr:ankyrin 2,3/unc44 [Trichoderma guizhouense]
MPATSSVRDETPTYTAEDLLSLDDGQFTEFVKRCERPEGGYDFSSASDLHLMVESRRQLLFERLRTAMRQLAKTTEPTLDIDTLTKRLLDVAEGPNTPRKYTRRGSRDRNTNSTLSPSSSDDRDMELLRLEELLQYGGRPVALNIALLTESERKKLPWLSGPYSWSSDEVPKFFAVQADRWWDFIKWQVDNRGIEAETGDYGFPQYLEAHRRQGLRERYPESGPEYDESTARMWESTPKYCEVPGGSFQAYQEAVKKRLASHNFTREFRLEADPRQQDTWTTWVEYLNFEYFERDRLAALLMRLEQDYINAWDKFLVVDSSRFDAFGRPLAEPEDNFGALQQRVDIFIRDTYPYRSKEPFFRHQRVLTQWILEQLSLIEAETKQQRTAKDCSQSKSRASKKRKQTEDEENEDEGRERSLKRAKQDGGSDQNAVQQPARGRPKNSTKTKASRRGARKSRLPGQPASPQKNTNLDSQKSQSLKRRSCAEAMVLPSPIRRRSQRLQARLQERS